MDRIRNLLTPGLRAVQDDSEEEQDVQDDFHEEQGEEEQQEEQQEFIQETPIPQIDESLADGDVTVAHQAESLGARFNAVADRDGKYDRYSQVPSVGMFSFEQVQALLRGERQQDRKSSGERNVKNLPSIEYKKLITLSLTNFAEYRDSIKVVGHSRRWPNKYSNPSLEQLREVWDGVEQEEYEDVIRSEAFLVIYQTIPASLKYLVRNVKTNDVLELWRVLYKRFLHVTNSALKAMKTEWENLSMSALGLPIDEFISVVSSKATNLRMVGEHISDKQEAIALLCGLPDSYAYVKRVYNSKDTFSFDQVSSEVIKFAVNEKFFSGTSTKKKDFQSPTRTQVCLKFNTSEGCQRKSCRFKHEKASDKILKDIRKKIEERRKPRRPERPEQALTTNQTDPNRRRGEIKCWTCGVAGHVSYKCPNRERVQEMFSKQASNKSTYVAPVFISSKSSSTDWVFDSGATSHITNNLYVLEDAKSVSGVNFTVGNDQSMSPSHIGSVNMGDFTFKNVYFCEKCPINLLSEGKLVESGLHVNKAPGKGVEVIDPKGEKVVMTATQKDELFVVDKVWQGGVLSVL